MAQLGKLTRVVQDRNGVALQSVDVGLYREGATVNGNQSGTSPLTVTVFDAGKIEASDTVFVNTTTGTTYNVNSTTDTTVVLSGFAGTLNLTSGQRLVPSNARPTIYSDDHAGGSTSNPLVTDANGTVEGFVEAGAYDVIVSGGTAETRLYVGEIVGTSNPGQIRYADEFATNSVTGGIQEAIDDLPSTGGKVVLSGKTYTVDVPIDLNGSDIWLQGAGWSTVIKPSSSFPAQVGDTVDGIIRTPNTGIGAGTVTFRNRIIVSDLQVDCMRSLGRNIYAAIEVSYTDDIAIRNVLATNGENFGIICIGNRVTVSGCHVYDFNDNANSNGISVSGYNQIGDPYRSASVTNNIVEDIGTIGIDVQNFEGWTVADNEVYSCLYGIVLEGNDTSGSAGGGPVRGGVIVGNTIIGTTDTNESGAAQNNTGIVFWLRATSGGLSTDLTHYGILISDNVIKDYKCAFAAAGGHWKFEGNQIYNWGLATANRRALEIGTVFGTALRMDHIAIVGNYFHQDVGSLAASGDSAAIHIGNSTTAGQIDNVVIKGNIVDGMDNSAGGANQFGLFLQNPGSNYVIEDNTFIETSNAPIRVNTQNVAGSTPTNWSISRNTMINCVAKSGAAAASWISLADGNNFTWAKINIIGNIARDTGSNMSVLVSNSGTGWTGALTIQDNVAPDVTTALLSLVANTDAYAIRNNVPEFSASVNVTTVATTIPQGVGRIVLASNGAYSLNTTPTIPDGYDGQRLQIINNSANIITFTGEGGLAGSNMLFVASPVNLGTRDLLEMEFSSAVGAWLEVNLRSLP